MPPQYKDVAWAKVLRKRNRKLSKNQLTIPVSELLGFVNFECDRENCKFNKADDHTVTSRSGIRTNYLTFACCFCKADDGS